MQELASQQGEMRKSGLRMGKFDGENRRLVLLKNWASRVDTQGKINLGEHHAQRNRPHKLIFSMRYGVHPNKTRKKGGRHRRDRAPYSEHREFPHEIRELGTRHGRQYL